MPSSAPADGADYIPAETFSGSKLGYVFQSGTQGTGYYKDGVDKGLPPPPTPAGLIQSLTKAKSATYFKCLMPAWRIQNNHGLQADVPWEIEVEKYPGLGLPYVEACMYACPVAESALIFVCEHW